MWVKTALLLVCVAIISTTLVGISDDDKLDPFNMLNSRFKHEKTNIWKNEQTQEKEKLAESRQEAEKSHAASKPDFHPHLQILDRVLKSIVYMESEDPADPPKQGLILKLSHSDFKVVDNFVKNPTKAREISAVETLLKSVQARDDYLHHGHESYTRRFLEGLFGCTVKTLVQTAVLIVLGAIYLLVISKLRLTMKLVMKLMIVVFIISVAMTWYTLYKEEEAKQRHAFIKGLPENCKMKPEDSSIFGMLKKMYRDNFTLQNEACVNYHENLILNPMAKVSITNAISVTVTETLFKPMGVLGTAFNDLLRSLQKDLPVQWQIPSLALFLPLVVVTLFVIWWFRHKIPFGRSVEQHPIQTSPLNALEGANRELKKVKKTKKKKKKKRIAEASTLSIKNSEGSGCPGSRQGDSNDWYTY